MNIMERHNCPLSNEDVLKVKSIAESQNITQLMQNDIQSLKEDVKDIKDALLGDAFNPGFKQRIEAAELKTDDNTKRLDKLAYYFAAFVTLTGVAGTIFGILKAIGVL